MQAQGHGENLAKEDEDSLARVYQVIAFHLPLASTINISLSRYLIHFPA